MPLDGHSYLVAQGWTGKGTGLRKGAISRPLAIPKKKTLSGLGKDRDEAFPFWDHLFSAAAKSIQLKCTSEDEGEGEDDASVLEFKRTATGILSTRRPITGTPADSSGSHTPDSSQPPRASLLSIAKREAAKRGLYARFFRGPILGPDSSDDNEITVTVGNAIGDVKTERSKVVDEDERALKKQKKELIKKLKEGRESKRRRKDGEHDVEDDIARAKRKEEKRRKRELREAEERSSRDGKRSREEGAHLRRKEKLVLGDTPPDLTTGKPSGHGGRVRDIAEASQDPEPTKKRKRKQKNS